MGMIFIWHSKKGVKEKSYMLSYNIVVACSLSNFRSNTWTHTIVQYFFLYKYVKPRTAIQMCNMQCRHCPVVRANCIHHHLISKQLDPKWIRKTQCGPAQIIQVIDDMYVSKKHKKYKKTTSHRTANRPECW